MSSKQKRTAYFVASFYGKEQREDTYLKIADIVRNHGYIVHDDINTISFADARKRSPEEVEKYWKLTAAKNINKADIFIAEISEKSTAIGVEIGMAVSDYKPTLILRDESVKDLPVPIVALKSRLTVVKYNKSNLESKIKSWLKKVDQGILTKFMNIGFSKEQVSFIEYVQKEEEIKSFALTVRSIIDGSIDVKDKLAAYSNLKNDD